MSDKLLEQYKLCVAMADSAMRRKQYANIFFFAVHSVSIPLLAAFVVYARYAGGIPFAMLNYVILITALVGIFNCLTWFYLLHYYQRLNDAKGKIVRQMETKLSFSPYCDEQEILRQKENNYVHRPLTAVESLAPMFFALFYVVGASIFLPL